MQEDPVRLPRSHTSWVVSDGRYILFQISDHQFMCCAWHLDYFT